MIGLKQKENTKCIVNKGMKEFLKNYGAGCVGMICTICVFIANIKTNTIIALWQIPIMLLWLSDLYLKFHLVELGKLLLLQKQLIDNQDEIIEILKNDQAE